jgi:hypothetical protein
MADHLKKPLQSIGPEVRMARFRFTPAASPALQTLSEGKGVASVTRTGAGAWTVQLDDTKVKDLECFVGCIENDTTVMHQVRVESQSASAGTIAISHKALTFASAASLVVVDGTITDVAAADAATSNRAYAIAPVAGTVTRVAAQIQSGGPLNAAAVVTTNINGTPITGGAVTIPDTTAVGVVTAVTPSAANTVAVGDVLTGVTDAAGSTTAAVEVQWTIQATTAATPAGSDTVDQIFGVVFYRVYD